MSDNGDNSMQDVEGGETTVFDDGAQGNGQNESDSAYGTLANTPASSTETLLSDDAMTVVDTMEANDSMAVDDTMEANDNMAVESTMEVDKVFQNDTASNDDGSYLGLKCDGCKHNYDDKNHVVLTGKCGHARCRSCWQQSNCLCPTCGLYSDNVRLAFPNEPTSGTANANSNQPKAKATDAQVKIRCMNGKTLEETVNTRMTVDDTKKMIRGKTGISEERQNLLHQGKTMTGSRTLHSYSVGSGSTIQMAEKCYGG